MEQTLTQEIADYLKKGSVFLIGTGTNTDSFSIPHGFKNRWSTFFNVDPNSWYGSIIMKSEDQAINLMAMAGFSMIYLPLHCQLERLQVSYKSSYLFQMNKALEEEMSLAFLQEIYPPLFSQ